MDITERIAGHFTESANLKLQLGDLLARPIVAAAEMIVQAQLNEKKVLACGNGGSAASAQYFASRMLNQFEMERPGLAAVAISADNSTLTAIANHGHFDHIFSKQVTALGHTGDVLLAISTSGNSRNILRAIEAAKDRNMTVIALSGGDGGELVELLTDEDIHIGVPHDNASRVQEAYILILHCLCDAIDCTLLGVN
ncbi:phosphoheptose isomerase [Methylovorus glucosotrophus]|jgi:D-sedoheptulose 7-phosphate isomerase|uniref:Phosphoheptose isomerase n=1 Tax=Methylovorus glucosotrophus (strain SIP3-4) TaxID=582744 RepID=C6XA14_METGS|nr:phosphoheptose isomerase [Methylovorus glucosotrophus]ACT51555.1 phosphoheptose isomerase [Methylovorus glucosotrophus SIP3-4]